VTHDGHRGYFHVRLVGCLVAASLGAGGFLIGAGGTAGAQGTASHSNAGNYDAAYPPPTTTTTTPSQSPPTSTGAPTVSGSPTVGGTLTAGPGKWSNNPTGFSYQWADCDASGQHCTVIPGATGSTYNVASSDLGHTIRVIVTATNGGGHGAAVSPATGVVTVPTGQVTSDLNHSLTPSGNSASINSILHNGGYTLTFSAPEGGTVTISWYEVPAGATLARAKTKHKPILVATGKRTFSKAGSGKVKIKLTKAGKKLLKHSKKLKLTAKGTFTQKGSHHAITVKKKFTVKKKNKKGH